jgi:hypothetical protein
MHDFCPDWACRLDYTAIFTALLFFATCGLLWATRSLVVGANDTAIRQLRGYLSLTPSGMTFTLAQPPDIHRQSIRIQAICKNHGQTPIRQIRYLYEVRVLPYPLPPGYQFQEAATSNNANFALPPHEQSNSQFERPEPLSSEELEGIGQDRLRIYWWGKATYVDVFDETRHLEFCASIVGSQFFVNYIHDVMAALRNNKTPPALPSGMEYPIQWDYCDRHGHGD